MAMKSRRVRADGYTRRSEGNRSMNNRLFKPIVLFCILSIAAGLMLLVVSNSRAESQEEEIQLLMRYLTGDDEKASDAAASALGRIDAPAVKPLIGALKDKRAYVREHAAFALVLIGPEAAPAVPALIPLAKDPDKNVRWKACWALGSIGPQAAAAIPALKRALQDPDPEVKKQAAESLAKIERKNAPKKQTEARREDQDEDNETEGKTLISQTTRTTPEQVKVLTAALDDPDKDVRLAAMQELAKIGPEARPAVKKLIEILQQGDEKLADAAGDALGAIGPDAISAMPAVLQMLKTAKGDVHDSPAANVAAGIGPDAWEAVPYLMVGAPIHDDSPCFTVMLFGEAAIPAILQALKEDDHRLAEDAICSLMYIQTTDVEVIAAMIEELKRPRHGHEEICVMILGQMGPAAKSAVPDLVQLLKSRKEDEELIEALGKIGPDAAPAVPVLIEMLPKAGLSGAEVQEVFTTLGQIGPAAKEAVPVLLALTKDQLPVNRALAAKALSKIDPKSLKDVPMLIDLLKVNEGIVRTQAIEALGNLGPAARSAKSALLGVMNNDAIRQPGRIAAAGAAKLVDPGDAKAISFLIAKWREGEALEVNKQLLKIKTKDPRLLPLLVDKLAVAQSRQPYVMRRFERLGRESATEELIANYGNTAVPALLKRLKTGDDSAKMGVLRALAVLGPDARTAAPHVIPLLQSPKFEVRVEAAAALGKIGPAPAAAPQLVKLMETDVAWVRIEAARALGKIGADPKNIQPALLKALVDEVGSVRLTAVQSLGDLGIKDPAVLEALTKAKAEKDPRIPKAAMAALNKLK